MLSGDADLEVRGPRAGFDEALYPEVARTPGVAVASPVVEVDAKVAERLDTLRVVGVDAFRAGLIQPGLIAGSADRLDTLRPDVVFLSPAAARARGRRRRCRDAAGRAHRCSTARGGRGSPAQPTRDSRVMDIAGAQAAFDRLGRLTRIDIRLAPGVDAAALAHAPAERVPARSRRRAARDHRRSRRQLVALVSRQSQRARAGRAFHRRAAGVLDAGARGGASTRAVRVAARARRHPRPTALH